MKKAKYRKANNHKIAKKNKHVKNVIDKYKMKQILDENGNGKVKINANDILYLYRSMMLTRILDDSILKLQREGRCGTYASSLGHEASQVGSAYVLKKEDWLFPYFRELGAHVVRNLPLELYLMYWMGDERGSKIPENINDFMISVPVGTQNLHAVGAAMASKIKKEKKAFLVYLGDGATSEGDFHEAMNFAGVFKAPVVFVCLNNQYAISVPVSNQTASLTLAQKAEAYGFDGIKVDGNDVFAVIEETKKALEKAKKGLGPTFIECYTYRLSDHTTSDDAKKYRSEKEVNEWKKKDPIDRLRKYIIKKKLWNDKKEKDLIQELKLSIEEIIKKAETIEKPQIEDMFKYTYANMPARLKEQLAEAKE